MFTKRAILLPPCKGDDACTSILNLSLQLCSNPMKKSWTLMTRKFCWIKLSSLNLEWRDYCSQWNFWLPGGSAAFVRSWHQQVKAVMSPYFGNFWFVGRSVYHQCLHWIISARVSHMHHFTSSAHAIRGGGASAVNTHACWTPPHTRWKGEASYTDRRKWSAYVEFTFLISSRPAIFGSVSLLFLSVQLYNTPPLFSCASVALIKLDWYSHDF